MGQCHRDHHHRDPTTVTNATTETPTIETPTTETPTTETPTTVTSAIHFCFLASTDALFLSCCDLQHVGKPILVSEAATVPLSQWFHRRVSLLRTGTITGFYGFGPGQATIIVLRTFVLRIVKGQPKAITAAQCISQECFCACKQ
jgi:hypothetical protein